MSGCVILYLLSKLSDEVDEQEESYNNDTQKVNSKDLEENSENIDTNPHEIEIKPNKELSDNSNSKLIYHTEDNDSTEDNGSTDITSPSISPSEDELYETIATNLLNYQLNRIIEKVFGAEVLLININRIKLVVNNLDYENLDNDNDNDNDNDSDIDENIEKIVKAIRSGSGVTILSPTSPTNSEQQSFISTNQSNINIEEIEGNDETINDVNTLTSEYETSTPKRKQIVIITKHLEQGENPLPLPCWHYIAKQPSDKEELKIWAKDNAIKKYWTSKFPFLNENYEQINLSSPNTIKKAI